MYWVGVLTAGMTAFYVFRAWFLAFFGEYRGHASSARIAAGDDGPADDPGGACRSVGGFINVPQFLEPMFRREGRRIRAGDGFRPASGCSASRSPTCSTSRSRGLADSFANAFGGLYKLVYNKYFVDEVYDATVVEPLVEGSRTVLWRGVDAGLIDGTVNGVGTRSRGIGCILRLLQSGNIRSYAAWVVLGSIVLLLAIGLAGGAAMTLLDAVIFLPLVGVPDHPGAAQGEPQRHPHVQPGRISLAIFVVSLGLIGAVLVRQRPASSPSKPTSLDQTRRPSTITSASTASACGW